MSELLKQIMDEYNAAKDDAEWESPHPIFQMAEHIDQLQRENAELLEALEVDFKLWKSINMDSQKYDDDLRELAFRRCNSLHRRIAKHKGGE